MKKSFTLSIFYKTLTISALFICLAATTTAQVSGNVFRDFNANGIKTTAAPDPIEIGLKDVTVNVYPTTGAVITTTTDVSGNYTISGGTGPYRVEFILPPYYYASKGSVSNTTVQFVTAGGTANLGVNYPGEYSDPNPLLAAPVYVNGYGSSENTLIGFPFNSTDHDVPTNAYGSATQIGGTWGVAFQRSTKTVFTSAIIKRHIGLGPLGIGGIYKVAKSATTNAAQNFVDVETIGIDVGNIADNVTRGLLTDPTQPNYDVDAFTLTGKNGIGDLDISENDKKLYFINLFDKKLYSIVIDADNNPATAPIAADVTAYTLPTTTCNLGVARPWAIKVYKGKVYVGVVCTGENGGATADLSATIYAMDEATGIFNSTPIFSFPLTYPKLNVEYGAGTYWLPWTDTQADIPVYSGDASIRPEPILADIEFDVDGSMILTFNDRSGHQLGYQNYGTDILSTNLYRSEIGGDILRVYNNNGTFVLENNGVAGSVTGSLQNNNGGPGTLSGTTYSAPFGEFYDDLTFATVHEDCPMGGSALLAGSGKVIAAFMDPINWRSGGFVTWSNTTGTQVNRYEIYTNNNPAYFGKANGVGDIELLSDAQPIEIGNRVFMDANSDGIQDPNEMGIDGIKVELWKAGAKVTDTPTANGGQWYFSNLDAATAYEVKILGADIPSGKQLTTANTASNAKDLIDNDATLVGSDAVITYTTGSAGENNHTLDFGFKVATCTQPTAGTNTPAAGTCNGATPNNDAKVDFTGITNADKIDKSEGATYTGVAYGAATGTVTGGNASITGLKHNTQYTFRIWNGADACFIDVTVTTPTKTCVAPCPIPNCGGGSSVQKL